jgi:hypothetical protein
MEMSGGSLGQGLPIARRHGARAAAKDNPAFVYNSMSDGELDEGSTWEAAMAPRTTARQPDLPGGHQQPAGGRPSGKVLGFEPLADKWAAFGWHVQRVDGNDLPPCSGLRRGRALRGAKPRVILFDTLMGKGVPFLEQREKNHFIRVDPPEWQQAIRIPRRISRPKESPHEHHRREKKPRLTTSAMIASIARRRAARQGRALRQGARRTGATRARSRRPDGRPRRSTPTCTCSRRPIPSASSRWDGRAAADGRAGGLAKEGLVPFATDLCVFGTRRAYDFMPPGHRRGKPERQDVLRLAGTDHRLWPEPPGDEDIAMMRGIPAHDAIDPCDALDIEQAVPQIAAHQGPVYMRCCAATCRWCWTRSSYRFELGKAKLLRDGADVLVISSGLLTMRALESPRDLPPTRWTSRCCTARRSSRSTRRDRRSRALPAPPGRGGGEPLRSWRARRGGGEHPAAAPRSAAGFQLAGLPDAFLDAVRCRPCTSATASAARRWARASSAAGLSPPSRSPERFMLARVNFERSLPALQKSWR